ncbi:YceI family protein [Pseudofulvimonas gallinarii]|jgi:polyisoprenoid-binding protein YceI|uniref:Polyisoprenoid-binding protein YceI n=1 Tax=Pseudofulvimonas gallinarii TaxID=634155 RepID=A0A4R3L676_9GAMM|nr:YceI family protein [Pseudofulvimonas gallinarii]TCS94360.1 polyisoprenoid-binding protein YceI [Pseudofulvimonas gallinarii]THD14690.1 polyisoprenoid-binding protein [Pseudofulvimonas gallinarii]
MKRLALATALFAVAAGAAQAETYEIDTRHTQVHFTYSHMGLSNITGRFADATGTIVYDPADPSSASIEISVPIASVSTGVTAMDDHFKRDDLFDEARFPTATFKSTSVQAAGEGKLKLTGDLTIHGVTREASFDVTVNGMMEHPMRKVPAAGFDAVGTIKRSDFGVDKYLGGIPDEVRINVTIEAIAAAKAE